MKREDSAVLSMFDLFSVSPSELEVYRHLMRKPSTIRQLSAVLGYSERTLRTCVEGLLEKKFIARKIVEAERLKYVYYARPADSVIDTIRSKLRLLNVKRTKVAKKMARDIVKGV